jgi:hypothetical protein
MTSIPILLFAIPALGESIELPPKPVLSSNTTHHPTHTKPWIMIYLAHM